MAYRVDLALQVHRAVMAGKATPARRDGLQETSRHRRARKEIPDFQEVLDLRATVVETAHPAVQVTKVGQACPATEVFPDSMDLRVLRDPMGVKVSQELTAYQAVRDLAVRRVARELRVR